MSQNFRSRPQVLAAINDIFVATMTEKVGAVDYTDREEWLHAPDKPMYKDHAPHHETAELLLALSGNEEQTAIQAEAYMVGRKIFTRAFWAVVVRKSLYRLCLAVVSFHRC
jgi:ATP-dependent exoDNAse (exonuclease V) beta subunit